MTELLSGVPAPVGGRRHAVVREVTHPTPRGVRLRLEVTDRVDHLPGQHYAIRLTAPDGYVAQRSYSIASPPSDPLVEFFVERLDDGEVSTYLADVVVPGDALELQGPIGGWFVWPADSPAVGVAGGSGVVPFVAMLRHAIDLDRRELLHLAVSARTLADLPYRDELRDHGAVIALTREDDPVGGRTRGRLSTEEIARLVGDPSAVDVGFVCGSAAFAEGAGMLLMDSGVPAGRIRVERFGPSG